MLRNDWHSALIGVLLCLFWDVVTLPGIMPRRRIGRDGASVVAAVFAAKPEEIPMTKPKPKHQTTVRSQRTGRAGATSTPLRKAIKPKPPAPSRAGSEALSGRVDSKQARVIAMLRSPSGTTIEAIMLATKWQQHSVRGFFAGVVRKKLGLNLVSALGESGRVYRIKAGKALAVTKQAA